MIYKAYLVQEGEGCDHTIGCAQIVIGVEANNMEEAIELVYDVIKEEFTGERALELCEIYEINKVFTCDLNDWYGRIDRDEEFNEKEWLEAEELRTLARLKAKYEGK